MIDKFVDTRVSLPISKDLEKPLRIFPRNNCSSIFLAAKNASGNQPRSGRINPDYLI
jgi:hypothetical protein